MHFIVLEGIDGTGKTTQMKHIEHYMEEKRIPYFSTKEPREDILGKEVYNNLKNSKYTNITELLLFNAIRAEHLKNWIIPNLNAGKVVICDRFILSTFVYQTILNGIDSNTVNALSETVFKFIGYYKPSLTILLDSDPDTIKNRNKNENAKDTIPIQVKYKLRDEYLKRMSIDSNIELVNANESEENITKSIYNILNNYFSKNGKY